MRTSLRIACGLVSAAAIVSVGPAAAAEGDGLTLAASTEYEVDLVESEIDVTVRFTAENRSGVGDEGGLFGGFSVQIPDVAPEVGATRNGRGIPITRTDTRVEGFTLWEVSFDRPLSSGQTTEVVVQYSLPSQAPRSDSVTRVNEAYFGFVALAAGDAGMADVAIALPAGFESEWFGGSLVESTVGEDRWLRADGVDPVEFGVIVTGRSDRALEELAVPEFGHGGGLTVAPWPGDDEWAAFVAAGATRLVPVLEGLVGDEWPIEGELLIREANSGLFRGYSGVFFADANSDDVVIEVGENLDDAVLAHELAHGWFNQGGAAEGWIPEGLAEELSRLAMVGTGGSYEPFPTVERDDPAALPLAQWRPFSALDDARDRYGYAAAAALFARLTQEIGPVGLREVLGAISRGESAYTVGEQRFVVGGGLDWRRLLDGFELRGGSRTAEAEFLEWVVPPGVESDLAARRSAITRFEELVGRAADWGMPAAVVDAMTRWDFETAAGVLGGIEEVFAARDEVATVAVDLGLAVPAGPRQRFGMDDDAAVADALAELSEQRDALAGVRAAVEAHGMERGWSASLGLWGEDPDGDLRDLRAAFEEGDYAGVQARSAALVELLDDAGPVGRGRVLRAVIVLIALLGLTVVVGRWWWVRRLRGAGAAAPDRGGEVDVSR